MKHVHWTEECEANFQELKHYLANTPHLVSPQDEDILYLYLVICNHAISLVLVKEDHDRVYILVYYTNKSLLDAETRYTLPEKLTLALVVVAKKL